MAITGEFLADFTSFFFAVGESEERLSSLERKSDDVARHVDDMQAAFDGGAVVSELDKMSGAIGDASKATVDTATQLGTMRTAVTAAGDEFSTKLAPAAGTMGNIATQTGKIGPEADTATTAMGGLNSRIGEIAAGFTLGSLFAEAGRMILGFAKDAIQAAGDVADLSAKFGLSTKAVQEFQFIADQTGGSMEGLAGAAREIAKNVAEGDSSAEAALKKLGLSFEDLRGKTPDQMLYTIATALGGVKEAGEQTSIAMELGGKKMVESLGAVNQGMVDLAGQAPVMQADVVESVDAMTDASAIWASGQTTDIQNTVGLWAVLIQKGPMATLAAYQDMVEGASPRMDEMAGKIKEVTQFEEQRNAGLKAGKLNIDEYEAADRALTASAEAAIKVNKETIAHEEAVAKIRAALYSDDVITKANDYVEALGGVDKASTLTKTQQEALNKAVMAGLEAYEAIGKTAPAEMLKVASATSSGVQPLIDKMLGLVPVLKSFSDESSLTWATFKAAVTDASGELDAMRAAGEEDWRALGGTSREELQTIADTAREKYDMALANSEHFTAEQITNFGEVAAAAQTSADAFGGAFTGAFADINTGAATTKTALEGVVSVHQTLSSMGATFDVSTPNPVTGEGMQNTDPRVQGYLRQGYTLGEAVALAGGGPTMIFGPQGQWTSQGWTQGSGMFAGVDAPRAGGATYNTTVNTGAVLGTESQIAKLVQDAMVTYAQRQGTRLPGRT